MLTIEREPGGAGCIVSEWKCETRRYPDDSASMKKCHESCVRVYLKDPVKNTDQGLPLPAL